MASTDLRDAFNAAAAPDASCSRAFLHYEHKDETQFQRLGFVGTWADGTSFEVKSDLIRPDADVNLVAREAALQMIAQRKPEAT